MDINININSGSNNWDKDDKKSHNDGRRMGEMSNNIQPFPQATRHQEGNSCRMMDEYESIQSEIQSQSLMESFADIFKGIVEILSGILGQNSSGEESSSGNSSGSLAGNNVSSMVEDSIMIPSSETGETNRVSGLPSSTTSLKDAFASGTTVYSDYSDIPQEYQTGDAYDVEDGNGNISWYYVNSDGESVEFTYSDTEIAELNSKSELNEEETAKYNAYKQYVGSKVMDMNNINTISQYIDTSTEVTTEEYTAIWNKINSGILPSDEEIAKYNLYNIQQKEAAATAEAQAVAEVTENATQSVKDTISQGTVTGISAGSNGSTQVFVQDASGETIQISIWNTGEVVIDGTTTSLSKDELFELINKSENTNSARSEIESLISQSTGSSHTYDPVTIEGVQYQNTVYRMSDDAYSPYVSKTVSSDGAIQLSYYEYDESKGEYVVSKQVSYME